MKILLLAVAVSAIIAATSYKSSSELADMAPKFMNSESAK